MNIELLYRTMQKQYNVMVDASNAEFERYEARRKANDQHSLTAYASSGAYDNAANSIKMIAEINGIPIIERVTRYENDVQFDSDRFQVEKEPSTRKTESSVNYY
jgi:hypothetical protein